MKKVLCAALLGVMAMISPAQAVTMSFNVQANPHVWNDGVGFGGNLGLATGILFNTGDAFSVAVNDVKDTWNFCSPSASCTINADGVRPASNTILGLYNSAGYSFAYGTLVGRVGTGDFFKVGTAGFNGTSDANGELFLFHWDHNTNNSGSIAATVSAVPLPASVLFLLAGIGGLTLVGRRRKAAPAAA